MTRSWRTPNAQYNVLADSPSGLRNAGREELRRGEARKDDRAIARGRAFLAEADRWEAEQVTQAARSKVERQRKLLHTLNKKDEFTAQYGANAHDQLAARERIRKRNQELERLR